MIKRLALFFIVSLLNRNSLAFEITVVDKSMQYFAVEHSSKLKLNVDDPVCVYNKASKVGCGKIVKIRDWGFMAKLEGKYTLIKKGDTVKRIVSRKNASVSQSQQSKFRDIPQFSVSIGSHLASSYLMPTLSIQTLIGNHFALGISPIFNYAGDESGSAFGYGVQLSANLYLGDTFDGLWIMSGLEYLSMKVNLGATTESTSSMGGIATVGYRFSLSKNVHMGLAFGGEYLTDPRFTMIEVGYSGLHGIGYFDFGFRF